MGYLQTHQPEHPVMRAGRPRPGSFYSTRLICASSRNTTFGRLAALVYRRDRHAAQAHARRLGKRRARCRRVLVPAEARLRSSADAIDFVCW